MSRKMINRIMATIYNDYTNRPKNEDEGLLEAAYDDFSQKYGLKAVCDRKFLEFVASLLKNASNLRSFTFLKFIGASEKINSRPYHKKSLEVYLDSLNYMTHAKIGISINTDDTADVIYLPTLRAIECLKEKLDKFAVKKTINQCINIIEKSSVADPKRINEKGLVEAELVLKLVVECFEEYVIRVQEGVIQAVKAIKNGEEISDISKEEFIMLIRNISYDKFSSIEDTIREDPISLDRVMNICIDKGFLTVNDLKEYLPISKDYSSKDLLNDIESSQNDLKCIISDISEKSASFSTQT